MDPFLSTTNNKKGGKKMYNLKDTNLLLISLLCNGITHINVK